jgi:hypothetical protein
MNLHFREVGDFPEIITDLMSDDEYAALQDELRKNPEKGNLIQGTGGARKIRTKVGNKGKSGGVRVVYYFQREETVWLLDAYAKSHKENLTEREKAVIRGIVERIKRGAR